MSVIVGLRLGWRWQLRISELRWHVSERSCEAACDNECALRNRSELYSDEGPPIGAVAAEPLAEAASEIEEGR